MCQSSVTFNLGVLERNPASTEGVIGIMTHLHQYVPEVDGRVVAIPCNGDQLSVERM